MGMSGSPAEDCRLQQGYWTILTGKVKPADVIRRGWAHSISEAREVKVGRSNDKVVAEFKAYSDAIDLERQGFLTVSLNVLVVGE